MIKFTAIVNRYWLELSFLLLGISPLLIYFFRYPAAPQRDWDYFNSAALLIRNIATTHQAPFLDHWVCGGIDILANPQNWLYSPFAILNLFLNPYLANLLAWTICAVFGYFGMLKLAPAPILKLNAVLASALFILSPFFFLHLAEGHLPYRTFYFVPWIFYYSVRLTGFKEAWKLSTILILMFLDGGLYPFYYSIIVLLLNLNFKSLSKLLKDASTRKGLLLLAAATLFLLSSKILPVLFLHKGRFPEDESATYSVQNILDALFKIKQSNFESMIGQKYYFHEYGHYLGFGITLLFIISLLHWKKAKWIYCQVILFAWIAFGIGGTWNPWSLIKSLPFINQLHVQSRFLILFYFMILMAILRSGLRYRASTALMLIACAELLFCAFYTSTEAFTRSRVATDITVSARSNALATYQEYLPKPEVYATQSISFACYEPAKEAYLKPTPQIFLNSKDPTLKATFESNRIEVQSEQALPESLVLNYNWNGGWDCKGCEAFPNDGLIQIRTPPGSKRVELTYNPVYWQLSLALFLMGLALLLYTRKWIAHGV